MNNFSDDLKKIFLAGVGAVAMTAEKSKEMIDQLVTKGELTVEQGKILNEELKHTVSEKLKTPADVKSMEKDLEKLSPEDLANLKEKIEQLQSNG